GGGNTGRRNPRGGALGRRATGRGSTPNPPPAGAPGGRQFPMRYPPPAAARSGRRLPVTMRPLAVWGVRPLAAFLCPLLIRRPMLFQDSLEFAIQRLHALPVHGALDLEDGVSPALVW